MKKLLSLLALAFASVATLPVQAAGTATGGFDVTVNLISACQITTSPSTITLAYTSFGAAPTPVTTGFAVQCTNTLPYSMDIGTATSTMAGVNLDYTLAIRNAGDTLDVTTPQTAGAAPTSYLIKASMAGGQQGTCATGTCSATATRTLTITY